MRLHEEVCPEIYYRALPHTYATGCAVKAPCTVKRTGSSRMRICPGFTDGDILPPTSFSASARLSSSASEPHTCAASHVQVRREWSVGPAPRAGHRELRRLQEATEGAKAATGGYGKLLEVATLSPGCAGEQPGASQGTGVQRGGRRAAGPRPVTPLPHVCDRRWARCACRRSRRCGGGGRKML